MESARTGVWGGAAVGVVLGVGVLGAALLTLGRLSGGAGPSAAELRAWGAFDVAHVEWWRALTATWVHASWAHAGVNAALVLGWSWHLRRAWLALAGFVAGGALGWLAAWVVYRPAAVLTLGASGGVAALAAASLVLAPRWPALLAAALLAGGSVALDVAGLISVDHAAHAGGALAGAVIGVTARFANGGRLR